MEENRGSKALTENGEKTYMPSELFPSLMQSQDPIKRTDLGENQENPEVRRVEGPGLESMPLLHPEYGQPVYTQSRYDVILNNKIQNYILNNPDELHEECRHRRGMERDTHKSILRQSEVDARQRSREKNISLFFEDNTLVRQVINGNGFQVSRKVVLLCRILGVRRYHREGSEQFEWTMILEINATGAIIESPLYMEEILHSNKRISETLLERYMTCETEAVRSEVRRWIRNYIIVPYGSACINEIPLKAGWFRNDEKYHLVTGNDEGMVYCNDDIKKFMVKTFTDLDEKSIVKAFAEEAGGDDDRRTMSILFLFRIAALLLRVISDPEDNVQNSLILIGDSSGTIARTFLRTMQNSVDVINIDSDRIRYIRDTVLCIRDTPIIIMSSDPNNRSTQNRLNAVRNWLDSGYIEGNKIVGNFVFCIYKFAKSYSMDEMVVIDAEKINIPHDVELFAELQSIIVKKIENSGDYWIDEFRKEYKHRCRTEKENK